MSAGRRKKCGKATERMLSSLEKVERSLDTLHLLSETELNALLAADLVTRESSGRVVITAAGRRYLARREVGRFHSKLDPFLAQHLDFEIGEGVLSQSRVPVLVDAESPLVWLARRKGRDGRALIEPHQLAAGERLRFDFTRGQIMPRTTSNWDSTAVASRGIGGERLADLTDAALAARERFRRALDNVGPEFSDLLIDVCCFLKRLEDVERRRCWPARSAKVILQLGLDRLGRHYGLAPLARRPAHARIRRWASPEAERGAEP